MVFSVAVMPGEAMRPIFRMVSSGLKPLIPWMASTKAPLRASWADRKAAAVAAMPFTYSISDGIMFGVIAYTVVNALSGKFGRIHWIMYVLTALFVAKYALM